MKKTFILLTILAALAASIVAGRQPLAGLWGLVSGEPFCRGWPVSHWRRMLAGDPAQQAGAIEQLEGAGPDAVPVLVALLEDPPRSGPEVRCLAAELLGKTGSGDETAVSSLVAALDDPDAYLRSVASAALAKSGAPADIAVPALVGLLQRERNPVHVRALSEYRDGAQPGLPVLLEILADPQLDSETRWNAARTIGKIGPAAASAVPALAAALQAPAATIREHAAEALGDIGPPAAAAVQPLAAVLHDSAPRVRRDAVRSLGQIGQPARAVVNEIQELLKDKEDIVREAARNTLQTIAPELLPTEKPRPEAPPSGDKE